MFRFPYAARARMDREGVAGANFDFVEYTWGWLTRATYPRATRRLREAGANG
jgi:hypothetical protein